MSILTRDQAARLLENLRDDATARGLSELARCLRTVLQAGAVEEAANLLRQHVRSIDQDAWRPDLEEMRRFEESLPPFDRWLDGRDLNGLEELVWTARTVVKQWGERVAGFQIESNIARLAKALEPFAAAPDAEPKGGER